MNIQIDLVELKNVTGIPFEQLSQFAHSLQLCIEQASRKDAAGRVMASGLLSAYDSKRYTFPINNLDLLGEDAAIALLDVFRLKRNGAKIDRLITNGVVFLESIAVGLFPEKQDACRYTVSIHPDVTHRQLLIMLKAIDCEFRRADEGSYVIQPRQAHSNTNIYKFPHRKGQFGATSPATPE
ncbi:MAG: hypothetical protein KZQ94_10245 [Candidatus Thiodiazotropha sp. (ex Troendleina suluensis)]|nr:hypothetical protein [Candidatus Thiodiazotropha sp. (ex Troendleina suluensis)]